ncbi:hypothetical protein KEM52_005525 [Ascosphaera acerosa]|nr:hypothetical protein KEM52_005525 [Ascosphaera acerosa]
MFELRAEEAVQAGRSHNDRRAAVQNGYGQHEKDLSKEQLDNALKYFWIAEWFFWACCGLTKISVILLYQRIFDTHFRKIGHCCLALSVVWMHLTVFLSIYQCQPTRAVWDRELLRQPGNTCFHRIAFSDATAVINTVMHCLLFLLPIYPLRRISLPERQTKVLCLTFGLCALAGGFSLYRTVCVLRHQMLYDDPTWTGACQAMCDTLEANIAIICPCLPMVPSLLSHYFPWLKCNLDYRRALGSRSRHPDDHDDGDEGCSEHQLANRRCDGAHHAGHDDEERRIRRKSHPPPQFYLHSNDSGHSQPPPDYDTTMGNESSMSQHLTAAAQPPDGYADGGRLESGCGGARYSQRQSPSQQQQQQQQPQQYPQEQHGHGVGSDLDSATCCSGEFEMPPTMKTRRGTDSTESSVRYVWGMPSVMGGSRTHARWDGGR